MGFPLNDSYDLMAAFLRRQAEHHPSSLPELYQFRLFAFVLHDPDVHKTFDSHIAQKFEQLDHSTGSALLFFCLTQASRTWTEGARDRKHHRVLEEALRNEGRRPGRKGRRDVDLEVGLASTSTQVDVLLVSLGITRESLPCLVVTPNLGSPHFMVLRTDAVRIDDQLNRLGYLATLGVPLRDVQSDFSRRPVLGVQHSFGEESLARLLAEAFAVIGDANHDGREASVAAFLERASQKLMDCRGSGVYSAEFEGIAIALAEATARVGRRNSMGGQVMLHQPQGLEPQAKSLLMTADATYRVLCDSGNLDFTPFVICVAKAFEIEVGLSMVQLLRAREGIEMPRYFARVDPEKGHLQVWTGRSWIGINDARDGEWRPPSLGHAYWACFASFVGVEGAPPAHATPGDSASWDTFWPTWRQFFRVRNDCAHVRAVGSDQADEARNLYQSLIDHHHLAWLVRLKQLLRS